MTPTNNYSAKAPNPQKGGLIEILESFLLQESRNIHTTIPAEVISVNYDTCTVVARPLIRMMIDPNTKYEVAARDVEGIPIIFTSAKRGAARVSVPVSEGDVGLIIYCERETEKFLLSNGTTVQDSGVYEGVGMSGNLPQIGFLPEVFTPSAARSFLKDTLVVEYSKAITHLKADGTITNKNDNCSNKLSSSGDLTFTNSGCSINATSGGSVTVNAATSISLTCGGASITMSPDGTVKINDITIIAGAISCESTSAASSLTVAGVEMDGHTHSVGTYTAGSTTIEGESGEPI
jgi:hypothetical protein